MGSLHWRMFRIGVYPNVRFNCVPKGFFSTFLERWLRKENEDVEEESNYCCHIGNRFACFG
jgi:hypothetical protein